MTVARSAPLMTPSRAIVSVAGESTNEVATTSRIAVGGRNTRRNARSRGRVTGSCAQRSENTSWPPPGRGADVSVRSAKSARSMFHPGIKSWSTSDRAGSGTSTIVDALKSRLRSPSGSSC
jgi:hypothetical protein